MEDGPPLYPALGGRWWCIISLIMGWLDAGFMVWMAIGAWRGAAAGMYRAAFALAGWVLSLVLSVRWAGAGARWLAKTTAMDDLMRSWLMRTLPFPREWTQMPAADVLTAMGGASGQRPPLPGLVLPAAGADTNLGEYVAALITDTLVFLAAFAGIALAVGGACSLAGRLLQATLGRLPFLAVLNRVAGALLGMAQAAVAAAVIAGLGQPVVRLLWPAQAAWLEAHSFVLPPLLGLWARLAAAAGV